MRNQLVIFTFAILPALAGAQQQVLPAESSPQVLAGDIDAGQDQVQAATVNATANLRDQILRMHLTRDLTVNDFLERTNSQAELTRVLKNVQPVGGPRWVDERTCQIQVELPASQVGSMLMGIAHAPGGHSPVKPEMLKAKFNDWAKVKFSVVGSSAGGDAIESARPVESAGMWTEVSDAARKAAVDQARSDAARQITLAIDPIPLSEHLHCSDALARPAIAGPFSKWLEHRPVTRIDFLDDLKVSVTISVAPKSMAAAFKSAVQGDGEFARASSIDWEQFNRQIEDQPSCMMGTASAILAAPATSLPSVVLPLQPPDWVDQQIQAEATASGGGARLKVGRRAESNAIGKIRDQFLLLHLDPATTLGDASHADPQLKSAVDRALQHAHTYRVDYNADGSVHVKVDLDLRDAWDALRANP